MSNFEVAAGAPHGVDIKSTQFKVDQMRFNRNPGRPVSRAGTGTMVLCVISLVTTLLVAGCGGGGGGSGGGGGGGGTTNPPPPATYAISGAISGSVTMGVTVALSGNSTASTTTDSAGNYSFAGLANGSYTVTPTMIGNAFTPASAAVTVNGANVPGTNFVANAVYSISGTVTGPFVTGVTMTLSGGANNTTQTSPSGTYSFASLPAGKSYTVTPSLPGYTYAPTSATVTLTSDTTLPDFVATPVNTGTTISGKVTYLGAKTGTIYLSVNHSGGGSASAGTSTDLTTFNGTYSIRGLPPGSYVVVARMDSIGTGVRNASDPIGTSQVVTVPGTNLSNVNITLADVTPVAAQAPTGLAVYPSKNAAAIFWNGPKDANGVEQATGYNISWGTSPTATGGGVISIAATGNNDFYFQTGFTSAGPYYYKIQSLVTGAAPSAWSPIVGPIPIGASSGPNTVSGTITFPPGTATGPMYVGLYSQTNGLVFTTIPNPVSPQSYSVDGVVNGNDWQVLAILDQNNNGVIDTGDISNFGGGGGRLQSLISISTDPTTNVNRILSAAGTRAELRTAHYDDDTYGEQINVFRDSGTKLPVRVTVVSAAGAAVPFDVGDSNGDYQDQIHPLTPGRPNIGDTVTLQITYSDGTSELLTPAVNAVLDSFAQTLTTTPSSGSGTPKFNWAAPFTPPNPYSYTIWVNDPAGNTVWYYAGTTGDGMPKNQLSVMYNADGSATLATLATGTAYTWYLSVNDGTSNRAVATGTYTP